MVFKALNESWLFHCFLSGMVAVLVVLLLGAYDINTILLAFFFGTVIRFFFFWVEEVCCVRG